MVTMELSLKNRPTQENFPHRKKAFYALAILALALGVSACKQLVSHMTFHPDKFNIVPDDRLPTDIKQVFITTTDKVRIHGLYFPSPGSNTVLIYFHGNAGNIYHRIPDLDRLRNYGINVLGISYRGYGKSEGSPSEKGIYLDGEAAFNYVTNELSFLTENVLLFGRSIGSTVAVNLAQDKPIRALILVTPLTTGKEVARANGIHLLAPLAGNAFNNQEKIENLRAPLLVVHGTNDRVIPLTLGKTLYEKAAVTKRFAKIEGADHNNLQSQYALAYWAAIENFLMDYRK